MGYRLSKIYTRTGDDGTTGLADGSRLSKSALRVEVIGTLDELNCHLGILLGLIPSGEECGAVLERVQHHLFDLGGEFAIPGSTYVQSQQVAWLEQSLDHWNTELPPLKNFILPGGSAAAAQCHLARAVCRRAERVVVALGGEEAVNDQARQYLNRLSDLLFVAARRLARHQGGEEVLWRPGQ